MAGINNTFTNCRQAIVAQHAGANIQNVEIERCIVGVSLLNCPVILVENNEIAVFSRGTGIDLKQNDRALSMLVADNTITVESPPFFPAIGGRGIAITEMEMRPDAAEATIEGNSIHIESGHGVAILANAVSNLKITGNDDINLMGYTETGIQVSGSQKVIVSDNNVIGAFFNPNVHKDERVGLRIKNTFDATFNCNYFHELGDGIQVASGMSSNALLKNNVFDPPLTNGIHYEDNLLIGRQLWHGNEWRGDNTEYRNKAALNEVATSDPLFVFSQRYDIENQNSTLWPPSVDLPNYSGPSGTWINLNNNQNSGLCEIGQLTPNEEKPLDRLVAEGLGYTNANDKARMWDAERVLHAKIQSNQFTPPVDYMSFYDQFEQMVTNNNIGAFAEVQTDIRAAFMLSQVEREQLNSAWTRKWNALVQSRPLLYSLDENSTETDWQNWINSQSAITLIDQQIGSVYTMTAVVYGNAMQDATINNSTLSPELTVDYERNEKEVHDLYLATVVEGNYAFTAEQANDILFIADQCPLTGGHIVHQARSLYRLIDDTHTYEDDCNGMQALNTLGEDGTVERTLAVSSVNSTQKCTFAPNPVNGRILQISSNLAEVGALNLIHPSGKQLASYPLPIGEYNTSIELPELPSGLYWLQWSENGQAVQSNKIVAHQ